MGARRVCTGQGGVRSFLAAGAARQFHPVPPAATVRDVISSAEFSTTAVVLTLEIY